MFQWVKKKNGCGSHDRSYKNLWITSDNLKVRVILSSGSLSIRGSFHTLL